MRLGRLEVSGGALAVLALLYYLDDSGTILWVLLGCLAHEMGHWWAIRVLGGQVTRLRLTCAGAELRLSAVRPLPVWGMLLATLAGPGVNLVLAWLSIRLSRRGAGLYFFAGLNLGLACFNLLPAEPLDGGRAMEAFFAQLGRAELGRRLAAFCSEITAGFLLAAGLALLRRSEGRNFTLLAAGLWMEAVVRRRRRGAEFLDRTKC